MERSIVRWHVVILQDSDTTERMDGRPRTDEHYGAPCDRRGGEPLEHTYGYCSSGASLHSPDGSQLGEGELSDAPTAIRELRAGGRGLREPLPDAGCAGGRHQGARPSARAPCQRHSRRHPTVRAVGRAGLPGRPGWPSDRPPRRQSGRLLGALHRVAGERDRPRVGAAGGTDFRVSGGRAQGSRGRDPKRPSAATGPADVRDARKAPDAHGSSRSDWVSFCRSSASERTGGRATRHARAPGAGLL
jgi:hypothetical protein